MGKWAQSHWFWEQLMSYLIYIGNPLLLNKIC